MLLKPPFLLVVIIFLVTLLSLYNTSRAWANPKKFKENIKRTSLKTPIWFPQRNYWKRASWVTNARIGNLAGLIFMIILLFFVIIAYIWGKTPSLAP